MNINALQKQIIDFQEHIRIEIEKFEQSTGTKINRVSLLRKQDMSVPYPDNLVGVSFDVDVIDLR